LAPLTVVPTPVNAVPDPTHHDGPGLFRNPWKIHNPRLAELWRFARESRRDTDPTRPGSFASTESKPAIPRAKADELSVTWVGHSTFLIQTGNRNVLTDPVWGKRASPVPIAGPRRYMPPGMPLTDLPPIDVVLVSHNHYDHLDARTVRRLSELHPDAEWLAPLGLERLLARLGATRITEADWWHQETVHGLTMTAVPAQHFSGRGFKRNQSLWCGWVVSDRHCTWYFVGDTGWFPEFGEVAKRTGPSDLIFMPIGAYEPRWFMAPVHVNPEEAVEAFRQLTQNNARPATMVAMHWGTFKLTTEPMNEPPIRTRTAWQEAGLADDCLWILAHGETRWFSPH